MHAENALRVLLLIFLHDGKGIILAAVIHHQDLQRIDAALTDDGIQGMPDVIRHIVGGNRNRQYFKEKIWV